MLDNSAAQDAPLISHSTGHGVPKLRLDRAVDGAMWCRLPEGQRAEIHDMKTRSGGTDRGCDVNV